MRGEQTTRLESCWKPFTSYHLLLPVLLHSMSESPRLLLWSPPSPPLSRPHSLNRLVVRTDVDAVHADVLDRLQVRLHLLLSCVTVVTAWWWFHEWNGKSVRVISVELAPTTVLCVLSLCMCTCFRFQQEKKKNTHTVAFRPDSPLYSSGCGSRPGPCSTASLAREATA